MITNRQVAAFYVNRTEINSDDLSWVPLAAALPRIDVDVLAIRPGDHVFVVDEDDNMSSAVVIEQTAMNILVRVNQDWFRMSLADVEMRALAVALQVIRSAEPR